LPISVIESKAEFQLEVRDNKTVIVYPSKFTVWGWGGVSGPQVNTLRTGDADLRF